MDMREYEYNVRHRGDDLRREMEHHRLVESLMETRPSLFGRLQSLFRRVGQKPAVMSEGQTEYMPKPAVKPTMKPAVVAAAATVKPCQPEHA